MPVAIALSLTLLRLDAQTPAAVTKMVAVDGHRLKVRIAGAAQGFLPTVVFESGIGTPLERWGAIQAEIAKQTATFSYDRAGIGGSEPGTEAPTFPHIVSELHSLLQASGMKPPYLLVGHSLGGPISRLFVATYPNEVAGLVYVDPGDFSGAAEKPGQEGSDMVNRLRDQSYANRSASEQAEYREARKAERSGFALFRQLPPMPDLPLVVLLGAIALPGPSGMDWKSFAAERLRQAVEHAHQWTSEVSEGWLVVTPNSSHYIQDTEPELVVWGIRKALFPEIGRRLARIPHDQGAKGILALYRQLRASYPAAAFKPNQLNSIAYRFLRAGKVEAAIQLFQRNVSEFPSDWNVYDSLGEAYLAAGQRKLAIENYEKSVQLNPGNGNGKKMLEELQK